jgi:hypothetical protein
MCEGFTSLLHTHSSCEDWPYFSTEKKKSSGVRILKNNCDISRLNEPPCLFYFYFNFNFIFLHILRRERGRNEARCRLRAKCCAVVSQEFAINATSVVAGLIGSKRGGLALHQGATKPASVIDAGTHSSADQHLSPMNLHRQEACHRQKHVIGRSDSVIGRPYRSAAATAAATTATTVTAAATAATTATVATSATTTTAAAAAAAAATTAITVTATTATVTTTATERGGCCGSSRSSGCICRTTTGALVVRVRDDVAVKNHGTAWVVHAPQLAVPDQVRLHLVLKDVSIVRVSHHF